MIDDKKWIRLMEIGEALGCHQMPERSFFINGFQFPVCARCTGMMIGYILAIVLFVFDILFDCLLCVFLILPLVMDGVIQYKTQYISNNFKRVITGIMYGVGLNQLIIDLFF